MSRNNPRRFNDALGIAAGACNPSGIAHSIVAACQEARAEPNHQGTAALTSDPAIKLMVHQLAFICGIVNGAEDFARAPDYSACTIECEQRRAKLMVPEDEQRKPSLTQSTASDSTIRRNRL